ncbi:MAG: hypothetical protein QM654_18365, partial [Dysgonamonadaceae bacterium]
PNPLFCGRIQFAPTHQRRTYPQPSFIIHHSKYSLPITITGVHIRIYISNTPYSCYFAFCHCYTHQTSKISSAHCRGELNSPGCMLHPFSMVMNRLRRKKTMEYTKENE